MMHTADINAGVAIRLHDDDLTTWRRKQCGQTSYANKYPRCREPLRDDELPDQVTLRAAEIVEANPYLNARKYFMDVTQAQWLAIREYVIGRDSGCVYCGAAKPSHVDHVLPVSRRGSWHPDNCVAACARCNCSKGGLLPSEWRASK